MRKTALLLMICICLIFSVTAAWSTSDKSWKVTRLDNNVRYVSEINSRGEMVGGLWDDSSENCVAALLQNANTRALTSTFSDGLGINNKGLTVGCVRGEYGNPIAAVWNGKKCTLLPGLGEDFDVAYSVNDLGEIVGTCSNSSWTNQAAYWRNGSLITLETLTESGAEAVDINNLSTIIGCSWDEMGDQQAVLWKDGQITNIGALWQNSWSSARAINNNDTVVGIRCSYDGWTTHAFVYQNGDWYDLPSPDGATVCPADINNKGQVIGSVESNYQPQGVLWDGDQMIYLADCCNDPAWEIDYPISINDKGQIISEARYNGERCYCLLSPPKSK